MNFGVFEEPVSHIVARPSPNDILEWCLSMSDYNPAFLVFIFLITSATYFPFSSSMPATSSSTSTSSPPSPLLPSSPAFMGWFRSVYILVPAQLPPPPLLVVASTSTLWRLDLYIVIKFSKPPLSHRHRTTEAEAVLALFSSISVSADIKKQTVFFLQTADIWSTSSAAEGCKCGPQTADVLASKKQTTP
ncbi:hypothetical protein LXL04_015551 [Taraxacum kok-saghyz]